MQLYEKHCSNPYFQFVPSITDSKSTVFNSSSFRSSSSFSAQSTISSFSSISASTADYANTEDEELTDLASLASTASDFPDDDTDFVDEFFLFPYTVLDADFDTICSELSRYSPDIERCDYIFFFNQIIFLQNISACIRTPTRWVI